jgi:ABC-type multidrug transport system fused ATPase/permease subunit
LNNYLEKDYSWFLNNNSSELGRSIISEISSVIHYSLTSMINLSAQIILTILIISVLMSIEVIVTLYIFLIITSVYFSILIFFKKKLSLIGKSRLISDKKRFYILNELFSSIKLVKLKNLENFYLNNFSEISKEYASNGSVASLISFLPKSFIEIFIFGGLIVFILILILIEKSFTSFIPLISLYTFAGYRLIPSLQQIYVSITQLRFSKSMLINLHRNLISLDRKKLLDNLDLKKINLNKILELREVSFNYLGNNKLILDKINLKIPAFKKIGIIGSSGSGKTTLIDIILGLLDPSSGSLIVDGIKINKINKRSWQKNLGYVTQDVCLADASIASNIAFEYSDKNINQSLVEKVAKQAKIHNFIISLPKSYNTIVGERGIKFSGGEKQRIAIARALYNKPAVLVLDEATSSLDYNTEKLIMDDIFNNNKKITIIKVAHRLNTLQNCDFIYHVRNGQIKFVGKYKDIIKNNLIY